MPLTPDPGSTLGTAYNVGTVNGRSSILSDSVGASDLNDYLRFTLGASASSLSVSLSGLSANANLQVVRDANNNGTIDVGEVIGNSTLAGTASERINLSNLAAGNNYYVRVYQASGSTNYNLTLVADYAGSTTVAARNIGIPPTAFTNRYTDFVGNTGTGIIDAADVYRFNVTSRSNLNAFITNTGTSVNFQLLDSNGNVIQNSLNGFEGINPAQTIARLLNPGTYFVRVTSVGDNSTNYTLNIAAPPVSSTLEWVKQLGTASNFDQATDVAVDGSGNVYVVGHTTGQLLGDNAGFYDGFLTKYNSNGVFQWTQEVETIANDYVYAIAIDSAGNIYIGGQTQGNVINVSDAFVAKYSSSGSQTWLQRLGATSGGGGLAQVNDLTLDAVGNLYVTGRTANGGSSNFDAFVGKYSTDNAARQWFNRLGTPNSNAWDEGLGIAVDSTGAAYISGRTSGNLGGINAGNDDAFLIKYSGTGTQQWIRQFGSSSNDYGNSVAVDASDNVYIAGYAGRSLGGTGSGTGYLTSFSTTGTRRWTTQFGSGLPTDANDVKVDRSGNIYVAGGSQNAFGSTSYGTSDAYFLRFNDSGVIQQGTTLGTYSTDGASGIALDSTGNIYITGTTFSTLEGVNAYGTDVFIAKF
jgi:Beta-propeller repeat/Bacterial pre-peptidase C-terminal domain